MLNTNIGEMLVALPAVIVGFTLHEYAHAAASVALGDRTPIDQHRLTLNPLSHISWLGLLLVLVVGFGWAKPVQFNPASFRHPKRGEALVALAGPIANFAVALVSLLVLKLAVAVSPALIATGGAHLLYEVIVAMVWINLLLFLFNLVPIPPLDGSHLLLLAVPARHARLKEAMVKYGALLFLVIIVVGIVTPLNIFPIGRATEWLFRLLSGLLFPG